jgi:hypothetical protein
MMCCATPPSPNCPALPRAAPRCPALPRAAPRCPALLQFINLSAMLYSGDVYLQAQARSVIERSGDFLLASGQVRAELR